MKLKVIVTALCVAGFAASFAFADNPPTGGTTTGVTSTTTTTTSTTTTKVGDAGKGKDNGNHGDKTGCSRIELKGSKGSGSLSFTVDKANKKGSALNGQPVTLTIPADASIKANVCLDASGNMTLQELKVSGNGGGKGD
jgi:hypothetical protein